MPGYSIRVLQVETKTGSTFSRHLLCVMDNFKIAYAKFSPYSLFNVPKLYKIFSFLWSYLKQKAGCGT